MAEPDLVAKKQSDIARDTYRYLRVGMPLIIVGLAAAVAIEASTAHCLKTSISAYYFAPVHSIFIAALCALGALLIIYKGVCDTEDALLSLAGVLAFFVAMVPTPRHLRPYQNVCGKNDLPADYSVDHGVTNNVWAVVIALIAVQAFGLWKYYVTKKADSKKADGPSCGGIVVRAFLWSLIVAGAIALQFCNSKFLAYGHYTAAVIMFVAIVLTVVITAIVTGYQREDLSPHKQGYQTWYRIIAIAMGATVVSIVASHFALHDHSRHWIIGIEAMLILEFAIYWITQTVELWERQTRIALLQDHRRNVLLAPCTRCRKRPLEVGITRDPPEQPSEPGDALLRFL